MGEEQIVALPYEVSIYQIVVWGNKTKDGMKLHKLTILFFPVVFLGGTFQLRKAISYGSEH
jgi:hypothetical protein